MKPKGSKDRISIECAGAGDIISVAGLSSPIIGDTVANVEVCSLPMYLCLLTSLFKSTPFPLYLFSLLLFLLK